MSAVSKTSLTATLLAICPAVLANTSTQLSGGEALVVTFRQGRVIVIDAALAYRFEDGRVMLPLEETSAGLGLAITVDTARRRADGYYLSEELAFHLDLERGIVESGGRTFGIDDSAVIVGDADLFVSLASLNAWLRNMHFEFNVNDLFVEVSSNPPLPAVQRQLREEARKGHDSSRSPESHADLPQVTAEYAMIRSPVVDVNTIASWSNHGDPWSSTTLRGAQDLLYLGTRWFVNFDRKCRPQEARVTMSRKDPEGGLLGPLNLTEVEVGDIVQPRSALATSSLKGLGFRFTDRIRDISSGSTTELRGELPEGWEAELYQNDILSASVAKPDNGQYVFSDLPLYAGTNEFKVVLFGPQGQREEYRKAVRLGADQPAPGKAYIDGAVLAQDAKAIPVERWMHSEVTQSSGNSRDMGALAGDARVVYGVVPGVSLAASGTSLSMEGKRLSFAGLSMAVSHWDADLNADLAFDQARHMAAGARLMMQVLNTGFLLQHETFGNGYRAPLNILDTKTITHRSELRVNRRIDVLGAPISTVLRLQHVDYEAADPEIRSDLNASVFLGWVEIYNQLVGSATRRSEWTVAGLQGAFNVSSRYRYGWLRAGLEYSVKPEWRATGILLSADVALPGSGARVGLSANHRFENGTSIDLGLGWTLPQAEVVANLGYNTMTRETIASVGLRYSLDWIEGGLLPHVDHRAMASSGLARAQVFIDRDSNGVLSAGDEPLRGVRFKPGREDERTDGAGRTTLTSLAELRATDVIVEEESLPDPFLRSSVPGYRVVVRPGAPVQLAFPVVWVSDVEGRVLVSERQRAEDGTAAATASRGLGNVQVVVLNEEGREVRRVRSEFDGFFGIMGLRSGRYRLVMDSDQAARFGLDDGGGTEVTLHDDTGVLSGVELSLTPADRP